MSRNEEKKIARMLAHKKFEAKENPFTKFGKDWYLRTWLEKAIYVIGFFCICWELFNFLWGLL